MFKDIHGNLYATFYWELHNVWVVGMGVKELSDSGGWRNGKGEEQKEVGDTSKNKLVVTLWTSRSSMLSLVKIHRLVEE